MCARHRAESTPGGFRCSQEGSSWRLIKPRMLSAKWTVGTPSSLVTGEGDACCSPDLMTSTQCRQECPPPLPQFSPPTPALHLKPCSPSPFLCPQPSPTCREEFEVEAGGPGPGRGSEHWTASCGELDWSLTVWPEWLPSLDGFLTPRAEPGQHKASESSMPPYTRRGRICLTLTRTEGWRDPHPRVPQGCPAPPL